MHGTVGDVYVDEPTVVFLVVQRIVLQADGSARLLCSQGIGYREETAEQRVLAQVFIGAPARGDALDVDGGPENHILAAQPRLSSHAKAVGVSPLCAPCGSQCRPCGEERGRVGGQVQRVPGVRLHLLADAEGPVGIFHVGDAEPGDAFRGEHVLAMQHGDFLFEGHLADKVFDLLLMTGEL